LSYDTAEELLEALVEGTSLSAADLDHIIANLEEGQHLDFKDGMITHRRDRKRGGAIVREYVCGFANAEGGVLIIGVADSPRRVSPCKPSQPRRLVTWVEDLLRAMAPFLSPPPRIQVVNHTAGPVLVIATSRSLQLVFTVEAGKVRHYLRVHSSTVQIPEYLLSDLVLGRRHQPLIALEMRASFEGLRAASATRSGLRFYAHIENTSLTSAINVEIGMITWTLDPQPSRVSGYLRGHVEVQQPNGNDWKLRHALFYDQNARSGYQRLTPFASNPRPLRADGFVLPLTGSFEVRFAAYVVTESSAPQWWQCSFRMNEQRDAKQGAALGEISITKVSGRRPLVGILAT